MFERIRGAIAGEPKSPIPSHTQSPAHSHSSSQRQVGFISPNFLSPFLKGDSLDPKHDSPMRRKNDTIVTPKSKSPGTIRASAAALLSMASSTHPPPFNGDIDKNSDGIEDDIKERNTLENQIKKRDHRISKLHQDLTTLQNQYRQLQKDHTTLRRQQLESTHRHDIALKLWSRTNEGLKARVESFEKETTAVAAKEIASLIRDAAPPNKDSAYLMMLQEQLNKATVKLDHLGGQTEIVLHKGEEVVESLREEMNEVIRERSRMEIELLDQEKMLEEDKKWMVLKTERRLKRVQGEIDFLEKKAVKELKNKEGKDEEEDEASEAGSSGSENNDDYNPEMDNDTNKKVSKNDEALHEAVREELRAAEKERDRTISLLQAKLFEKNNEYAALMRVKEQRAAEVMKLTDEKRDREMWQRSREDMMPSSSHES